MTKICHCSLEDGYYGLPGGCANCGLTPDMFAEYREFPNVRHERDLSASLDAAPGTGPAFIQSTIGVTPCQWVRIMGDGMGYEWQPATDCTPAGWRRRHGEE